MWPSWAALRGWVARHRTKLIVAGVLLGTGLYLYRRWQGAVGQFRKLQERMERLSSVQNLYARDQSIALDVALASQATLRDLVIKLVEVPNAAQIRSAMQSTNPQEKVAMWERVKERSFTQVLTALLAFPLYALFQRVQLTLLSRHAARAAPAATPPPPAQGVLAGLLTRGSAARGADESALTEADKHAFLSQCAFFLATGLPRLVALVEARMRDRIAALPLQQTLDGPAVRALLASLTTQALQELGSPLALLYDAAAPAAAAAASPALAAITAATKAELQSAAFASAYRALVTQLSLRLADRLAAAATPAAAPLVRLLHAVGKLTDALLPAEAAAARTVAEEVHHAPAAEEYMRRLFGVFDELEASLLSGLA